MVYNNDNYNNNINNNNNYATKRLLENLPDGHVIVRFDFSNAFNFIRRDVILDSMALKTPEIYRLVHAAYSCEPILTFGQFLILSREGSQGPLSSLEFCEAIDPLLKSLDADVTLGFMDDITLSGELGTIEGDVEAIIHSASETQSS